WRIVVLDATAQGERQQLFRQRGGEEFRMPKQCLFEATHTVDIAYTWQCSRHVDGSAVSFVVSPATHRVEILQGESHGIDRPMTVRAHRIAAMGAHSLPYRQVGGHVTVERRHVRKWWRRRRTDDVAQDPHATNHR